jgi:hypothetical protein
MIRCAPILAILLFFHYSQRTLAQEPAVSKPGRDGSISGRVISLDGQPMAGARVMATPEGKKRLIISPTGATADEEGNFKIEGLSLGTYRLSAVAPAYVEAADAGQPLLRRVGDNATIRMEKGGVITGRVLDESGEPMVGVAVIPVRVRGLDESPAGRPPARLRGGASTDDRGVYRIYGLEPGVYVVKVSGAFVPFAGPWRVSLAAPTYHPSSARAGATELSLAAGQEISGVDINCRLLRGSTLSGTITGATGDPGAFNETIIKLLSVPERQSIGNNAYVRDGSFVINGVEDGVYELAAAKIQEKFELEIAGPRRVVVKGADQTGITLKFEKMGSVAGRVVVDPAKPPEVCKADVSYTPQEVLIGATRDIQAKSALVEMLEREGFPISLRGASPDEKGEFTLNNIDTGRIRLSIDLPDETWYIRSLSRKVGATATPIAQTGLTLKAGDRVSGVEAVLSPAGASLKGKVVPLQEGGALPRRSQLLLLPVTTAAADDVLQYADCIVGPDGAFEVQHLAPGKYWALLKPVEPVVQRPADLDPALRAKLRKEAESRKVEIELKPCQRVDGYLLRW